MHPRLRLPSLPTPVIAVALVAAGALLASGPASAGPPSPRRVHREVHNHLLDVLGGVHDVLSVLDRIPVQLDLVYQPELEVYFGGQEYYGPHRHHHELYRFPVRIDGRVVYRPQFYCGARLFAGGDYRGYQGRQGYRGQGYPSYQGQQGYRGQGYPSYQGQQGYRGQGYGRDDRRQDSRGQNSRWRNDRDRGRRAAPGNDSRHRRNDNPDNGRNR